MANAKYYLEKVKLEGQLVDILAKSNGENVTVTYNGEEQKLSEALVKIYTGIDALPTTENVGALIQTAISQSGHAHFEKAESVPEAETAQENVLYLVMNSKTKHYDIYAKVGDKVELLDDTTVDLSGYATKEDVETLTEAVNTKADASALNAAEEKIGAVETTVAGKADTTALTAATERVDALETTVGTKADKTDLDAKADKTDLDSKADKTDLDSKADKTVASAEADGLMSAADKKRLDAFRGVRCGTEIPEDMLDGEIFVKVVSE